MRGIVAKLEEILITFFQNKNSENAEQISNDSYGIENMDAKYLAEDLIENESEIFCD